MFVNILRHSTLVMQYFLKKQNPLFTVEDRFSVTTQDRNRKNPLLRTKSELNSSLCAMNHFSCGGFQVNKRKFDHGDSVFQNLSDWCSDRSPTSRFNKLSNSHADLERVDQADEID